ncbi:MAG: hypothetical protein CM1200mP18_04070 [Gammaproteobacteria bacterium]|nr:MAG: hypothetical protein CM1200mP18_04070 [Gammaproteobacteria bacterium]
MQLRPKPDRGRAGILTLRLHSTHLQRLSFAAMSYHLMAAIPSGPIWLQPTKICHRFFENFLETLRAVHRFEAKATGDGESVEEFEARVNRRLMVSEHPLVTVHPETSERVLYCSPLILNLLPV